MAEEKDDDIERLRRMLAGVHEKRKEPSRLKNIFTRLRTRKIRETKNDTKQKRKTDAA
jgi:hypothetical protein